MHTITNKFSLNRNGQFIDDVSGEKLREYYFRDYRTNPAVSSGKSFDEISWNDLGTANSDTECRLLGYVLVHRTTVNDYVCTTKSTSEMWKTSMGKPVSGDESEK